MAASRKLGGFKIPFLVKTKAEEIHHQATETGVSDIAQEARRASPLQLGMSATILVWSVVTSHGSLTMVAAVILELGVIIKRS